MQLLPIVDTFIKKESYRLNLLNEISQTLFSREVINDANACGFKFISNLLLTISTAVISLPRTDEVSVKSPHIAFVTHVLKDKCISRKSNAFKIALKGLY